MNEKSEIQNLITDLCTAGSAVDADRLIVSFLEGILDRIEKLEKDRCSARRQAAESEL